TIKHSEWRGLREVKQCPKQRSRRSVRKAQMSSIKFINEIFPRFGICPLVLPLNVN
ncbi:unnamed protein product, partial [Arabidopsis lyrata]